MATVKVAKLRSKTGNRRPKTVAKAMARDAAGRLMEFFTIDASSPTFGDDLAYVYRTNVARARRENKKLFGSADGVLRPAGRGKSGGSLNAARKK